MIWFSKRKQNKGIYFYKKYIERKLNEKKILEKRKKDKDPLKKMAKNKDISQYRDGNIEKEKG